MVRGMPPQSGAQSAANGQSVRHGLDTDTGSGRARQEIHEGTQYPYDGRADELLDLSSLTERMSAHPKERKDDGPADEHLADVSLPPRPLNLAAVRAQLQSKAGKPYWRTLEELAGDPGFEDLLHREFPRQAPSEWDDSVDRRDFLKLMAASLALAGLSGCGRAPEQYIVPYVKQPDGLVPGKPRFYATAMPFGADAIGLLVESHEGRPTKIEGNPDHPSSLGATNAFAQASLLDLYDPDRAQTVTQAGEIRTWSQFLDAAQALAASFQTAQGGGFRILTGIINSPTVAAELQTILTLYPQAKWHRWEPAVGDGTREGAKLAFGSYVSTVYRPENADVILSIDSDFLASGPGNVRYMRDFYRRRKLDQFAEADGLGNQMSRLYVVEPTPSVTGSSADHRLPLRYGESAQFARALAAKLGLGGGGKLPPGAEKWLDAVVKDLKKHPRRTLVVAGEQQPAEVHALAHAINASLGNVGTTLYYTEPVEAHPVNHLESLRELCADTENGKVSTLIIVGVNPVYTAPHDFDFAGKLRFDEKLGKKKIETVIYISPHFDETAQYCDWHVAESHYLETWGDARAFDGTVSVVQPLIAPLYKTHSVHETLAAFTDEPGLSDYDAVRDRLQAENPAVDFEKFWRKTLNDGVVAGTTFPPINVSLKFTPASLPPVNESSAGELEFLFRPDPSIYDGRFANNGWLQELPKPVTKLTWDNAALVSPKTAQKLDLTHTIPSRGGEHGQVLSDVIDIALSGSKVTAAAWILPGQAEGVVVLPLGYGRKKAGYAGTNKGFNAYVVRTSNTLWAAPAPAGVIRKTGNGYPMACTQYHFNMESRHIMMTATLEEYRKNPNFAKSEETPPENDSLYKGEAEFPYKRDKWAMSIDLNSCNGCN